MRVRVFLLKVYRMQKQWFFCKNFIMFGNARLHFILFWDQFWWHRSYWEKKTDFKMINRVICKQIKKTILSSSIPKFSNKKKFPVSFPTHSLYSYGFEVNALQVMGRYNYFGISKFSESFIPETGLEILFKFYLYSHKSLILTGRFYN